MYEWTRNKRKKRSPIWKIPRSELEKLVLASDSAAVILRHFGLSDKGGNSKTLRERLDTEKIPCEHLRKGRGHNGGRRHIGPEKRPMVELLVEHCTYTRVHLKRRLIQEGVLENICAVCGQEPEWNSQPLVLVLDHINGTDDDCRRENLRLLCPNCNSQTPTFCGRNQIVRL